MYGASAGTTRSRRVQVAATARRPSAAGELAGVLKQYGIERRAADKRSGIVEYRLKSNGLSILLAERHSAPVVTVMMLYKVGSRNEATGYTGATHFLEHMMFKGSKNFDPARGTGIDDVLKPIGGINNATTFFDRTSYFEVVPSKDLSLCLQFEADRMRNLLLREADRKSEMTVVRNELERQENEADLILHNQLWATAFRAHPYHNPIIGWRTDVEGVPTERLRQFYKDFYWPDNATLLVVGDFDTKEALASVARYFNGIPRSPRSIPPVYTSEPPQEGERRFTIKKGADQPKIVVGFHVARAADRDTYPLALLEAILGDESRKSSRLYKALIATGLASNAYAAYYQLKDPGLFCIGATARKGDLAATEEAILQELQKLASEPVGADELKRAKSSIVKRMKLDAADPLKMAQQIGESIAVADWKWWADYADHVEAVTAADITAVCRKYFSEMNRTVGYYLPKTPQPSAWQTPAEQEKPQPEGQKPTNPGVAPAGYRSLSDAPRSTPGAQASRLVRGGQDDRAPRSSDRSRAERPRSQHRHPPIVAFSSAASIGAAQTATNAQAVAQVSRSPARAGKSVAARVKRKVLANGLTVLVLPVKGTGTVCVAGKIAAGGYFAPADKTLLPDLLADMLTHGSQHLSKEQLAQELEEMGTSLEFEAATFWIRFNSDVTTEDAERFLSLLAKVLVKPLCESKALDEVKGILESEIKQKLDDTKNLAWNALVHEMYSPESPYYEKTFQEQLHELPGVTDKDVLAYHQRHFLPGNTVLALVGDIEPQRAFALVESTLGSWPSGPKSKIEPLEAELPPRAKTISINVPDKENVDVYIGHPIAISLKSKDYFAEIIANSALGHDPFASRLAPVRSKYGLTYDIGCYNTDTSYGGAPWVIDFSVNPANVERALTLVGKLVSKFQAEGITPSELKEEAGRLGGEFLVSLRTPRALAEAISRFEAAGVGPQFIDRYPQALKQVSRQ
ncbi:MAG TPA: pitrilysin family protein, partial [Candidatus Obscuribacterales bacterium]